MKIQEMRTEIQKMEQKLDDIMKSHMKDSPQQVSLSLPKLSQTDNSDMKVSTPTIKLPKLKKVTEEANV